MEKNAYHTIPYDSIEKKIAYKSHDEPFFHTME